MHESSTRTAICRLRRGRPRRPSPSTRTRFRRGMFHYSIRSGLDGGCSGGAGLDGLTSLCDEVRDLLASALSDLLEVLVAVLHRQRVAADLADPSVEVRTVELLHFF